MFIQLDVLVPAMQISSTPGAISLKPVELEPATWKADLATAPTQ